MPRPEKVQAVADIKERLEDSAAVFLAEYAGLSVAEQQQLRRGLRAADGEFKIVKMTLARIAASELGHDDLVESLTGPTGLAFASGDAAAAAKVLSDFAKDHAQLVLKGGLLGGESLTPERVAQLAELDSREVLLAKIAGAFKAPMAGMAGLMAALPRNLASMMSQLIDKLPPAEVAAVEPVAQEPAPTAAAPEAADEPAAEDDAAPADDAPAAEATESEDPAPAEQTAPEAADDSAAEGAAEAAAPEDSTQEASDETATTDDEPAKPAEEE
jgi:large subunit ribosomal protein L10